MITAKRLDYLLDKLDKYYDLKNNIQLRVLTFEVLKYAREMLSYSQIDLDEYKYIDFILMCNYNDEEDVSEYCATLCDVIIHLQNKIKGEIL